MNEHMVRLTLGGSLLAICLIVASAVGLSWHERAECARQGGEMHRIGNKTLCGFDVQAAPPQVDAHAFRADYR